MKFPPMTDGKYGVEDNAAIECSCGNTVEIEPGEVFKFCSRCGKEHNKLRVGTSQYTYSGVMVKQLNRLIDRCYELYFESDVVTAGAGTRKVSLRKVYNLQTSGYIDASKAVVKMDVDGMFIHVYGFDESVSHVSIDKKIAMGDVRIELTDREIYSMSPEDLYNKVFYAAKGLYENETSREAFESKWNMLMSMSMSDIENTFDDPRIGLRKPVRRWWTDVDPKLKSFWETWIEIEEQYKERGLAFNFTLIRFYSMKRSAKELDDFPVLIINNHKEPDSVITYSDIKNGVAPTLSSFEFDVKEREVVVKVAK